jgi:uncharacterized protein (TIGR00730 family)
MSLSICVYCASSNRVPQHYLDAARELGEGIARRGHRLVYGGGKVGLMGEVARAVQTQGGHVTGVIPEALRDLELALESADKMIVTRDMYERKATMARLADAFIALPGGFGTLEEISEIIAHRLLNFHEKPCVILNLSGFYDALLAQFDRFAAEGFADAAHRHLYHETRTVPETLDLLERLHAKSL